MEGEKPKVSQGESADSSTGAHEPVDDSSGTQAPVMSPGAEGVTEGEAERFEESLSKKLRDMKKADVDNARKTQTLSPVEDESPGLPLVRTEPSENEEAGEG